jgi:O-antigen/teichoic acid export membrane protein
MLVAVLTQRDGKATAQRMALTAFAIRILSAALAFVSQIVLARLMGEWEYGIYVFIWVLIVLFGDLSCLGFHTAIVRFLPQYKASGAFEEIRGLTGTARIFAILSGSLLMVFGMAGLHFFGDRIATYYLIPGFLGLLALPMIALGDVLEGTSRANHWPVMALSPIYIIRPVLIIVFMLIANAMGADHTAVTAMQAALAATYVTALGQYAATLLRLRHHYDTGSRKVDFIVWLSVAFPIFLIEGASFLLTNSDVFGKGCLRPAFLQHNRRRHEGRARLCRRRRCAMDVLAGTWRWPRGPCRWPPASIAVRWSVHRRLCADGDTACRHSCQGAGWPG